MIARGRGWLVLLCLVATACAQSTPPPKTAAAAAPPASVGAKGPPAPPAGPPVTLMAAAAARPYELATVSVGSFDRLLANGVKLVGAAVPIPMTPNGLRDYLLSDMGVPPEVASNLDLASPMGAAIVALDEKGRSGVVLAIPARGPAEAEKLIAALGKPVMTSGPLTLLANAAGKSEGWVYRTGNVVVFGDEAEGMARGTMLALEARRAGADDATATIFPDAIARAHGTDVKTAIAHLLEQARQAEAAKNPGVTPDDSFHEVLGKTAGLIGDAERIEIGLSVDPGRGLIFRGRLIARPGTALADVARDAHPFEIDPGVLSGPGTPAVIGAVNIGAFWRDLLGTYRTRLAADKTKGAAAALAYYDAFLSGMTGAQTGIVSIVKDSPFFTGAFSTPLKDAVAGAKAAAALAKMNSAAMGALVRAQLGSTTSALFDWNAKRESVGKIKAMHVRMTIKKDSLLDTEAIQKWLGTSTFDVYQAVAGSRMLITFGRDARARLAAIATGKAKPIVQSASFTEAQAGAKGRDLFYYLDLAPIVELIGKVGTNPRLTAAVRAGSGPIPVVITSGGDGAGKVLTMDLTFPLTTFTSVGAMIAAGAMMNPS